jgi:hypothetical protein
VRLAGLSWPLRSCDWLLLYPATASLSASLSPPKSALFFFPHQDLHDLEDENTITIRECASSCQNPSTRDDASDVLTYISNVSSYEELIENVMLLLDCDYIYSLAERVTESICSDFVYVQAVPVCALEC